MNKYLKQLDHFNSLDISLRIEGFDNCIVGISTKNEVIYSLMKMSKQYYGTDMNQTYETITEMYSDIRGQKSTILVATLNDKSLKEPIFINDLGCPWTGEAAEDEIIIIAKRIMNGN